MTVLYVDTRGHHFPSKHMPRLTSEENAALLSLTYSSIFYWKPTLTILLLKSSRYKHSLALSQRFPWFTNQASEGERSEHQEKKILMTGPAHMPHPLSHSTKTTSRPPGHPTPTILHINYAANKLLLLLTMHISAACAMWEQSPKGRVTGNLFPNLWVPRLEVNGLWDQSSGRLSTWQITSDFWLQSLSPVKVRLPATCKLLDD